LHVQNVQVSRRVVRRSLAGAALLGPAVVASGGRVSAQVEVDYGFSNQILPTLGLPELNLTETAAGIEGVPASVPAGRYLVNYAATDVVGYLLFAQIPAGLSAEEELQQAKDAGSNDIQGEGWVYGGGSYALPGTTVQVVVELTAGEWNVVHSRMPEGGNFETDEIYGIVPLLVAEATPVAASASPVAELPAAINVELQDAAFVLDTDTIPTGPNLWRFAATGTQAHHVVINRTPRAIDQGDIDALFAAFAAGTPPAADNWIFQSTGVGYTALVSPGDTVRNEFDFEPGTYALPCFIADTETGAPHLALGMWANVTVA